MQAIRHTVAVLLNNCLLYTSRGMREADEEQAVRLGGLSFLLPYMLNVRHDGNVAAYVEGIKKQDVYKRQGL